MITIDGLRRALESNRTDEVVIARTSGGREIPLGASFLAAEARTLLAGGLLAELRAGGQNLSAGVVVSASADQGSPRESLNVAVAGDDAVKTARDAGKAPG